MLKEIIHILNSYEDIEYKIVEEKTNRLESYYVKKQLEMNRSIDVTHIYLTVYKVFAEDGKKYRGSSQTEIPPTATKEEIVQVIDEAVYAAGFVKNEYYPLVTPGEVAEGNVSSDMEALGLYATLEKLRDAVYAQDHHANGCLSYSEFFVSKKDVRIVNSLGLDLSYSGYATDMETAATWGSETEIYESYSMASCDAEKLGQAISRLFAIAEKKQQAKPTPELKDMDIILSGECLKEFFSYYYFNSGASSIYNNQSTFKLEEDLQGSEAAGDRVNLTLDPYLPGSKASKPYDVDGFPLKKTEIIQNGKLLRYWGSVRFSSYLDIPPTGLTENYSVSGGTHTIEELKKGSYVELLSFSDFQMDIITGDFASEIRLGFLYDGNSLTPITGGSISGNIKKVHGSMKMSVETAQYNNYTGPAAIAIRNVNIADC